MAGIGSPCASSPRAGRPGTLRRRRHADLAGRPAGCGPCCCPARDVPRAAAGQGAAAQQAVAQGDRGDPDRPRSGSSGRWPSRCGPRSTPAQSLGLLLAAGQVTEVGHGHRRGCAHDTEHRATVDLRQAVQPGRGPGGARRSTARCCAAGIRLAASTSSGSTQTALPLQGRTPTVPGPPRACSRSPACSGAGATRLQIVGAEGQAGLRRRRHQELSRAVDLLRAGAADVPSPLPQTAGRRSRKGVAEGPATAGGPRRCSKASQTARSGAGPPRPVAPATGRSCVRDAASRRPAHETEGGQPHGEA